MPIAPRAGGAALRFEPHEGLCDVPVLLKRVEELLDQLEKGAVNETSAQRSGDATWGARRLRAAAPDPRLVRLILRQRRLRDRYFESTLFADPAWDMLLELAACRAEHRRITITSLCLAAAVPATTALRWVDVLTQRGLVVREPDPCDKRRVFIGLADAAADAMARYFEKIDETGATPI